VEGMWRQLEAIAAAATESCSNRKGKKGRINAPRMEEKEIRC